jgi:hypothetical protein
MSIGIHHHHHLSAMSRRIATISDDTRSVGERGEMSRRALVERPIGGLEFQNKVIAQTELPLFAQSRELKTESVTLWSAANRNLLA